MNLIVLAFGLFILVRLYRWHLKFNRPARRFANVAATLLYVSIVMMMLSSFYPLGGIQMINDPLKMAIREGEVARTQLILSGVQLFIALAGCALYGLAVVTQRRVDNTGARSLSVPS